ncbi:MAG: RIP metalloprotease RseP [Sterolibacterium sp.]|nr:RIP metalloprotease RseP [Sterolibacterium sp.]MBP9799005.1 RIP metalloprotease RseP [Sterolibacterium sp.]
MSVHSILYPLAFVVALAILIVFHEAGHFLAARWCGVKVLRFSVGFGKVLWLRRFGADQTEWALAAVPLGGFVKMLDEHEGPVAAAERHRAFNHQPVWRRFLIVAAGPLANLLLAVLLYWLLFLQGSDELRPLLAAPPAGSAAAVAQLQDGDMVRGVNGQPVRSWQEMRWEFTRVALDHQPVVLEVVSARQTLETRRISVETLSQEDLEQDLLGKLGLKPFRPPLKPLVGEVMPGSAAERAGIRPGDEVRMLDGQPVTDWREIVQRVRRAPGQRLSLELRRGMEPLSVTAVPDTAEEQGKPVGRLGMTVQEDASWHERMFVRLEYGPLAALGKAVRQTSETAGFTLKMMGRMVTGALSWKNLSGPLTIADYAGRSAQMGWIPYLNFIALISISLGVLNLLPIPILDGGHLLYYIVELVKGGPLPERVMEFGQKIGLAVLLMLMAFALYNDFYRLVYSS